MERRTGNSEVVGQKEPVQLKISNRVPKYHIVEFHGGTLWRSLLRHCATNMKEAGSISDSVIGNFH